MGKDSWLSEELKAQAVSSLQRLIRVPSVEGKPEPNMPFGDGPAKALQEILAIGEELGFKTYNYKNMAGHIEMGESDDDSYVGVIAHVDVVPEGRGWTYPPYGGEIHDGYLYGRGALDDKGPAVASLFGMKAVQDKKIPLKRKIRLILGTNEETGSKGVEAYFKAFPAPYSGFTPDGSFPAIYAEFGIVTFKFYVPLVTDKIKIMRIRGGEASNMVPDQAEITMQIMDESIIEQIKESLNRIKSDMPWRAQWEDSILQISVEGKSAHGSTPDRGENAISYLMEILAKFDFPEFDFAGDYMETFAFSHNGEKLNVNFKDSVSGILQMNPECCTWTKTRLKLCLWSIFVIRLHFMRKMCLRQLRRAFKNFTGRLKRNIPIHRRFTIRRTVNWSNA